MLRPETPVVPDERFRDRNLAADIWAEIDDLHRRWAEIGCAWVNLRFGVDDGVAIIRVEANPDGQPLPDRGLPACNGGFDCR